MTRIDASGITADAVAAGRCSDERLAEHLRGWLWRTDAAHRFTYMSPSVRAFAGRAPEWHYGRTRQELGNINVHDPAAGVWLAEVEQGGRFGPLDFVRCQDGRLVWMRTIGAPVLDGRGLVKGYAGIAFEVPQGAAPAPEQHALRPPRRAVMRSGEIIIADCPTGIPCTVLNISANGAGLSVAQGVQLPLMFGLHIEGRRRQHMCEVRWRTGTSVGVRFLGRLWHRRSG